MKEFLKYILAAGILILFLPFLLTAVFSGRESVSVEKETDTEMILPAVVYREIPENAHMELIRAQAILARSRACCMIRDEGSPEGLLKENLEYARNHPMYPDLLEQCRQAVSDTEGQVLVCGGTVVEGPWFVCGNGKTRDGTEAMGQENYAWIVSVESRADIESPDYLSETILSEKELREKLAEYLTDADTENISDRISADAADSAGYVTEVSVGEHQMSGENFRELLGLPSSCFTIQKSGDGLRFLCMGKGHGLGLSQYGAERMAEEGKSAAEILKYYFPNAQTAAV